MIIKQVSVFLENKSGRLSEVTRILGDAGINISAFTIADTSDFGILRLVVSDPDEACKVLRDSDFSVQTTEVLLANSPNKPGGLAQLLEFLNAKGAFIEYMYAFSMNDDQATIVIRPTNMQRCLAILEEYAG
ncbi:ACT domain-containing protein [Maribellus luteus]|uniref:ACT domain-containing protein n=1 Tax=Maribellus luteus TaxID=2305463 RepID=A0A399SSX9_9BACT|nr:ACT domain-containing protein [Maribellus luteus]RIJ45612.1 ACT domain-containing protein [Maribellus luteus]